MQYKGLFIAFLSLYATAASAQKYQEFTMNTGKRVIKTDTVASSGRTERPLLADNRQPAAPKHSGKYKPVPLAGHKSYFGDKNDYMMGYCRQYLGAHTQTLSVVRQRSETHFPLIDNILTQHQIPKELKYLSVIESALNNKAVSPVGAVGPWQFMEVTGREMGLTINGKRDDRTDWYKSTNAAVKYLNILYSKLNDWLLVVAAYNSGPTPVERAIAITGSRNFWDIKQYLPRETQGHVMAFVATATIFECLSKYINIGVVPDDFKFNEDPFAVQAPPSTAKKGTANQQTPIVPQKPVFTKEELQNMAIVRISKPLSFEIVADELGIDKKQILDKWNPDYELFIYNTYPTDYYSLRIPKENLDQFIQKKETMEKRSKLFFDQFSM
ncbi:MAG: transglycosylase SLT domain-containing protein [Flavipsychrobacter sp.]|nr:transglycosylase SLT domain-containing protein [Flavipsychrobacter sp.]